MPELRKNILTGEWVSIAEERAKRPNTFKKIGLDEKEDECCPFCAGNEHLTTKDVYKSADGRVRIVSNKYPVLTRDSGESFGIHDVVIDTHIHTESLHEFRIENIAKVLIAIKARMLDMKKEEEIKYIQVFKNEGSKAGASQAHSHWQILAMPIIPLMQENIYKNSNNIYKTTGKCFICDEIISKNNCAEIYENDKFKAYCNLASKFSYEINIAPKKHQSSFENITYDEATDLAETLKRCLCALKKIYSDLSYNICIENSFVNMSGLENSKDCMHYYIQIIPRLGHLAGFEFATYSYINSVMPEKAAEIIKQML